MAMVARFLSDDDTTTITSWPPREDQIFIFGICSNVLLTMFGEIRQFDLDTRDTNGFPDEIETVPRFGIRRRFQNTQSAISKLQSQANDPPLK